MAALGFSALGQFPLGWSLLASAASIPNPPPASRTFTAGKMQGAKACITPAELVDYAVNWAPVLVAGETIESSSWASTGVSINGNLPYIQESETATTVWIGGGIAGFTYVVTNSIVTSDGRELQESFLCYVNAYNFL